MTKGRESDRKHRSICIVIPTYWEAVNIRTLIEDLEGCLYEDILRIIIIDDNSQDGTVEIVEALNEQYSNIVVNCRTNKTGVGSAIKDGLSMALSLSDCEFIVTMDADLSHRVDDIPGLLGEIDGVDIVQGSRYISGGRIISWGLLRRMISWTANMICRLLFQTGISDHTGFFCVSTRRAAQILADNLTCNGFEWAIERTLIAKDSDLKVKEVPITFINRRSGQSKLKLSRILTWSTFVAKTFVSRIRRKGA